jgi:hypothetical protein
MFLAFVLTLSLATQAEEVWVRNKPFEGAVEGSGSSLKVELSVLLEALDLKPKIEGSTVVFDDFRVPIETNAAGTQMVLLNDISVGAGLKVTRSRELGTVDIYSAEAGTQSAGDWADAKAGTNAGVGPATNSSTSEYNISVPPQLELIDDPSVMAALADKLGRIPNGTLRGLVIPKDESEEAVLLLLTVGGLPPIGAVTREIKMAASQGFAEGMEEKGAQRLAGPTELRIGGRDFVRFQHTQVKNGKNTILESLLNLDTARNQLWVVMLVADQANFNRVAPPFQQAMNSLVIK